MSRGLLLGLGVPLMTIALVGYGLMTDQIGSFQSDQATLISALEDRSLLGARLKATAQQEDVSADGDGRPLAEMFPELAAEMTALDPSLVTVSIERIEEERVLVIAGEWAGFWASGELRYEVALDASYTLQSRNWQLARGPVPHLGSIVIGMIGMVLVAFSVLPSGWWKDRGESPAAGSPSDAARSVEAGNDAPAVSGPPVQAAQETRDV